MGTKGCKWVSGVHPKSFRSPGETPEQEAATGSSVMVGSEQELWQTERRKLAHSSDETWKEWELLEEEIFPRERQIS